MLQHLLSDSSLHLSGRTCRQSIIYANSYLHVITVTPNFFLASFLKRHKMMPSHVAAVGDRSQICKIAEALDIRSSDGQATSGCNDFLCFSVLRMLGKTFHIQDHCQVLHPHRLRQYVNRKHFDHESADGFDRASNTRWHS